MNITQQIQRLLELESYSERAREQAIRHSPSFKIASCLDNPIISYLASHLEASPIRKTVFTIQRLNTPAAGEIDVHDDRFRGARALAKSALDLTEPHQGFLTSETLNIAFEPLMKEAGDKYSAVTQYLKFLINKNSYLKDHNLGVVSTLHRIMEYKRKEEDPLRLDDESIIDALYVSATAYDHDASQAVGVFNPYSCHPGTEERLLDIVSAVCSPNIADGDKPIESLIHEMMSWCTESYANQIKANADLGARTTEHINYILQQKLEETPSLLDTKITQTHRAVTPHIYMSCYEQTDDGWGKKTDASIAGYSGLLPDRFNSRSDLISWGMSIKIPKDETVVYLIDANAIAQAIIEKLFEEVSEANLAFMMLPFTTITQAGNEAFKQKVIEHIDSEIRELADLDDEINAEEPSHPIISSATTDSLQAHRARIIRKLWTDETSGLDMFPFTLHDIPEEDQRAFANDLSAYHEVIPANFTPSLGHRIIIASKLCESHDTTVKLHATAFMHLCTGNWDTVSDLCKTAADQHNMHAVPSALCDTLKANSIYNISNDALVRLLGSVNNPRLIKSLIDYCWPYNSDRENIQIILISHLSQYYTPTALTYIIDDKICNFSKDDLTNLLIDYPGGHLNIARYHPSFFIKILNTASNKFNSDEYFKFITKTFQSRTILLNVICSHHEQTRDIVLHIIKTAQEKLNNYQFFRFISQHSDTAYGSTALNTLAGHYYEFMPDFLDVVKDKLSEDQFFEFITQKRHYERTALMIATHSNHDQAYNIVLHIIRAARDKLNEDKFFETISQSYDRVLDIALAYEPELIPLLMKMAISLDNQYFNSQDALAYISRAKDHLSNEQLYSLLRQSNVMKRPFFSNTDSITLLLNLAKEKLTSEQFLALIEPDILEAVQKNHPKLLLTILSIAKEKLSETQYDKFVKQKYILGVTILNAIALDNPDETENILNYAKNKFTPQEYMAFISQAFWYDKSTLHYAAENNPDYAKEIINTAKEMLSKAEFKAFFVNDITKGHPFTLGETLLHIAADSDKPELVDFVLDTARLVLSDEELAAFILQKNTRGNLAINYTYNSVHNIKIAESILHSANKVMSSQQYDQLISTGLITSHPALLETILNREQLSETQVYTYCELALKSAMRLSRSNYIPLDHSRILLQQILTTAINAVKGLSIPTTAISFPPSIFEYLRVSLGEIDESLAENLARHLTEDYQRGEELEFLLANQLKPGIALYISKCSKMSLYSIHKKHSADMTTTYAEVLSETGKLSLLDRIFCFFTGRFSLAFSVPSPTATKIGAHGGTTTEINPEGSPPAQPRASSGATPNPDKPTAGQ